MRYILVALVLGFLMGSLSYRYLAVQPKCASELIYERDCVSIDGETTPFECIYL